MIHSQRRKKIFFSIRVIMAKSISIKSYAFFAMQCINILCSFLLLMAYTAPYTDPNRIPIVAFIGLIYPIAAIINVVFLMVWGLLKSKWFFLSTTILLTGIPFHIKVFSIDLSNLFFNQKQSFFSRFRPL